MKLPIATTNPKTRRSAARVIADTTLRFFSAALVLLAIATNIKLGFEYLRAGLDPSWQASIAYAQSIGRTFGTEITFTTGPLSGVIYKYYQSETAPLTLLMSWAMVASLAYVFVRLFTLAPPIIAAYAAMFVFVGAQSIDGLLATAYVCIVLLALYEQRHSSRLHYGLAIGVSTLIISTFFLAKFSTALLAVVALTAIDFVALTARRIPVAWISAVVWVTALAAASSMPITSIPAYIASGMQVTAGFSEAMSLTGPASELFAWLGLAAVVLIWICSATLPEVWNNGGAPAAFAKIVICAAALFLSFKHGFVRHDQHSLIAWTCLLGIASVSLTSISAGLLGAPSTSSERTGYFLIVIVFLVPQALGLPQAPQQFDVVAKARSIADGVRDTSRMLFDFGGWRAHHDRAWSRSAAKLRAKTPLPRLSGRVDVISDEQSLSIANGHMLLPRPAIQEYAAYSPTLIQKNIDFFNGPEAPDYLIFAPGSIDGRHPALADGSLWPIFLSRYRLDQTDGQRSILRKRTVPIDNILSAPEVIAGRLNVPIQVPRNQNAYFVQIDITRTLLGDLMNALFKPPILTVRLSYPDGARETYRVIPGILQVGSILVPTIDSVKEFNELMRGTSTAAIDTRPVSLRLIAGPLARLAYRKKLTVRLYRIRTEALSTR